MGSIVMDNWLVVGFKGEESVELCIHGDIIFSDNDCRKEGVLLSIESFDPFTPKAFSVNDEISLTLNGEMISVLGSICSLALEQDLIVWALVNDPSNVPHHHILEIIKKNSFKIEYTF
tara:strand:- start:473 stop:826 length:354 start_codon:yes stop_codon:yes gene_type:complete